MIAVILFGFTILGQFRRFPFDCEQIMKRNTEILETSTRPINYGFGGFAIEKKGIPFVQTEEKGMLAQVFSNLKASLRTGFRSTQQSISYKVCTVVVQELEAVYQNPFFQLAGIFAMYLLFYGVIRFLVWVLTLLARMFFLVLRLCGWYRTRFSLQEVEELE